MCPTLDSSKSCNKKFWEILAQREVKIENDSL